MPFKRKSRGRSKGGKGRQEYVTCSNCGAAVPRDKAKKFVRRIALVRGELARELKHQGAYMAENVVTNYFCISCAVHYGRVKVRAREDRRPQRFL